MPFKNFDPTIVKLFWASVLGALLAFFFDLGKYDKSVGWLPRVQDKVYAFVFGFTAGSVSHYFIDIYHLNITIVLVCALMQRPIRKVLASLFDSFMTAPFETLERIRNLWRK
ncbi:MAG: hypothetical protein LBU87_03680 [Lactobacillales bacterium]|jgi:hypothetical protein|nr:hypothetical protein [Lactobacillales bacterium]